MAGGSVQSRAVLISQSPGYTAGIYLSCSPTSWHQPPILCTIKMVLCIGCTDSNKWTAVCTTATLNSWMLNLDLLQAGATSEAQGMLAEAEALLAHLSKQKLSQAAIDAGPDTSRSAGSASPADLMLRCDVSGCAIVPVTRSSDVSSQSEQVAWRQ